MKSYLFQYKLLINFMLAFFIGFWSYNGYAQSPHPGTVSFSSTSFTANEGGQAAIGVVINGCSSPMSSIENDLSIILAVSSNNPGTATLGQDYTFTTPTTISLVNNQNWSVSTTINIDIPSDSLVEGDETFNLDLFVDGGHGALDCFDLQSFQFLEVSPGTPNSTTITIVDTTPVVTPLNAAIDMPTGDSSITVGETVPFASTITGGQTPYITNWMFAGGSPGSSTTEDPGAVQYNTAGTFEAVLSVEDAAGTKVSASRMVTVVPAFSVSIDSPQSNVSIPEGESVSFASTITGGFAPYTISWLFDNGVPSSSSSEDPGAVQYSAEGTYQVSLSVTDANNQMATATRTVTVNPVLALPDTLAIVNGNNQSIAVGSASQPLIVQVSNSQGSVSGKPVTFAVTEGSANLSQQTVATDVSGQAQTIVTPSSAGNIKVSATIDGNHTVIFDITGTQVQVSGLLEEIDGLQGEQQTVATVIDSICPSRQAGAALLARCDALIGNRVSDEVAAEALSQIAPEETITQGTQSAEIATAQIVNIKTRLVALRNGVKGLSAKGLALNVDGQMLSGSILDAMLPQQGGSAGDDIPRWGVFINGNVKFGDKDATTQESGFDFDTKGITLGVDYRVSDSYILGAAMGFASTGNDMANNAGNVDSDGYTLSFYGNASFTDNVYLDWIASYGWNNYDSTRNFNYEESPGSFVVGNARGDNDGTQYSVDLNLGYDMALDSLSVGGYARLSYSQSDIDGYQETGAESLGLNMVIGDQAVDSLTTALGMTMAYSSSQSWGVLIPQLSVEWEHEYNDDKRFVNVRFADDFQGFNIQLQTDDPDRNYFNVSVGLSAQFSANRSAFITYESVLGLDDVTSNSVTAGIRFAF